MQYLGMLVALIIAFYTLVFGLETWKEKNQIGFFALAALSITVVALPLYVLFFR
jgi:hypothetical protein